MSDITTSKLDESKSVRWPVRVNIDGRETFLTWDAYSRISTDLTAAQLCLINEFTSKSDHQTWIASIQSARGCKEVTNAVAMQHDSNFSSLGPNLESQAGCTLNEAWAIKQYTLKLWPGAINGSTGSYRDNTGTIRQVKPDEGKRTAALMRADAATPTGAEDAQSEVA